MLGPAYIGRNSRRFKPCGATERAARQCRAALLKRTCDLEGSRRHAEVEIPARDLVGRRIEPVHVAREAGRRLGVEEVVYTERETELVDQAGRPHPELHVRIELA